MARVLRGDVFWADLDPVRGREQAGLRPVLVVSHEVFNDRSGTVIAMAVTSKAPRVGFPLTVLLEDPNMPKASWVKIGQIRTLSVERLGTRVGKASPEELRQVMEGLNEIVGP
jgi:mRNA interferase MazF